MTRLIDELKNKNLINPPGWLPNNLQLLVETGSRAYACNEDDSDQDVVGIAIEPLNLIFPHTSGLIPNFDEAPKFGNWQVQHVIDQEARGGKGREYDITVYGLVRYFKLTMDGNPNMIDTLYVPQHCVLTQTSIGQMIRENRQLFLHRGLWHKFKGYAYKQKSDMTKNRQGKRKALVDKFGFDVKSAYHVVRLLNEAEQLLTTGDLHLDQDGAVYRDIRAGGWSLEKINTFFEEKERALESVYNQTDAIPYGPPVDKVRTLLMNCLEQHYGSLGNVVNRAGKDATTIQSIVKMLSDGGYV